MSSFFKVSINGVVGMCLAAVICLMPMATCTRSAKPSAEEPLSLASVALVLISGGQRGIGESESEEVAWVSDEKQWNSLISSIPDGFLEILPQPEDAPDIDFTKYGVLVIRMGQKPNGGYKMELTADEAKIENREARIPVRWSEPEPDFMYTQAIVHPYLIVKMEKGAFDSIAVIDQNGLVKLRARI